MLRRWIPGLVAIAVVLLAVETVSAQRFLSRIRARRDSRNETWTVTPVQTQQPASVDAQPQTTTTTPATVTTYQRSGLFGRRLVPVQAVARSSPATTQQQPQTQQQPVQPATAGQPTTPSTISQGTATYYERRGLFGRRRVPVQSTASVTGGEPTTRRSNYLEPGSAPVLLNLRVPANAELLIDGQPTTQTGLERQFRSPALAPGYTYTYTVEVRWQENGQQQTRTRRVTVQPGRDVTVDLTQPDPQ